MRTPHLARPGRKRTRSGSLKAQPLASRPPASRPEPQISIRRPVGKRLTIGVQFFETVASTASCRMACYFHDRPAAEPTSRLGQHNSGSPDTFRLDTKFWIPIANHYARLTTVNPQGAIPTFAGNSLNGDEASTRHRQSIEVVDSMWEDLQSKVLRDLSVEGIRDFHRSIVVTVPVDWETTRKNKVVELLAV